MKLLSDDWPGNYSPIPGDFAFCVVDPSTHVALSKNLNPGFRWDDPPTGTCSFAMICHDPDVPSKGDDVNLEGHEVPSDLPRVDFFHWVLVDIAAAARTIPFGSHSSGITARGKPGPLTHGGMRHGLNDYTVWFANDSAMAGNYFGYDGPCPPWNDTILHRYVFTLFALDIERVPVDGNFTGPQVRDAIKHHILAEASLTGTYTLNPTLQR